MTIPDLVLCPHCGAVRDAAKAAAGHRCDDCGGGLELPPLSAGARPDRRHDGGYDVDEALAALDLAWQNERRRHRTVRVLLFDVIGVTAAPSRVFGLVWLWAGLAWSALVLADGTDRPWVRLVQVALGLALCTLAARDEVAGAQKLERMHERYLELRADLAAGGWRSGALPRDRHAALMHWIDALTVWPRDGWLWLATYAAYLLLAAAFYAWTLAGPARLGRAMPWPDAWHVPPDRLAVVAAVWAVGGAVASIALTALALRRPRPAPEPSPAAPAPGRPAEPKPPVLIERS